MAQPILEPNDLLSLISAEEKKLEDWSAQEELRVGAKGVTWKLVQSDETQLPAATRSIWPPVLFRGQARVYDPAYPTVLRGIDSEWARMPSGPPPPVDHLRFLAGEVRRSWFVEHIWQHPLGQHALQRGVHLDVTKVAQHYGLPTTFIDLTESPSIAGFFATCRLKTGQFPGPKTWEPIANGVGVLYRIRLQNAPFGACRPVALQPFPRPGEQRAWVYEMWLGEDFQRPRCETQPCVESLLFRQSAELSRHFLAQYDSGAALFPPDPLAEIASLILSSDYLPDTLWRLILDRQMPQGWWLETRHANFDAALRQDLGLTLRTGPQILYTKEHMTQYQHDLNSGRYDSWFDLWGD